MWGEIIINRCKGVGWQEGRRCVGVRASGRACARVVCWRLLVFACVRAWERRGAFAWAGFGFGFGFAEGLYRG